MRTLFTVILLTLLLTAVPSVLNGQQVLDAYVEEGLKNNLVLQQRNISLEKANLALKIAQGLFAPTIALQGNYQSGEGGRSIAIPVGDLLNPVYSTLNQLTDSQQFPQIQNVDENFFPYNFYDVKVRTSMPIVSTDLVYNRKIHQQQILLAEFDRDVYKRELVKNIKIAYFNYLSALQGIEIYKSSLSRAEEGKRVNESLLGNGSGLPAYVIRSQSEIENTRAQIIDAERQAHNAKLYFNFLLNRPGTDSIRAEYPTEENVQAAASWIDAAISVQKREELRQLQTLIGLNENLVKKNKLYWSPRISGFFDLGSQAQDLRWNSDARYYLFGFQADLTLFAGFTNKHKIHQAHLDVKNAELSFANTSRQLEMSSSISRNSLITAYQNYISSKKQLEAARSYQKLIEKGYKEGVNTFIEAIDARNQLTGAQVLVNINLYKVLIAETNLERETAQIEISKK